MSMELRDDLRVAVTRMVDHKEKPVPACLCVTDGFSLSLDSNFLHEMSGPGETEMPVYRPSQRDEES